MNRPLDHLTDALIIRYLKQRSGTSLDTPEADIETHLSDCASCRDRVLQAQRVHYGLLEADPVNHAPHPDCPEEQVLQQLAAGICSRETASAAIQHTAHCDHCGPLLNRYLEEFSEELQPEDQALLSKLASGKPEWQEQFVREHGIAKPEQRDRHSFFAKLWPKATGWWPKMALAGGLAVLLLAAIPAAPGLWARFDLYWADRLVAAAYAERPIEMRLSNAPYASYKPLPIVRDGEQQREPDYKRPAFMKAEGFVAEKLQTGDPRWLWRQGQLSLLNTVPRSLEDAQDFLEKARAAGLDNPGLEIDLAASYFERDVKVQPPNLKRTIELLNRVLKNPKLDHESRSAALFDLAIAYEKSRTDMAISTWEDYLRSDASSPWADEARRRLQDAKSRLLPPRQQGYRSPEFFFGHLSDPAIQKDLEEYQNVALNQWLPEAVKNPDSSSHKAIVQLAGLLVQQHSDPWLKDLLDSLHPDDLPAVQALSAAFRANDKNDHDLAIEQSLKATNLFAQHGNLPGELRARVEQLYAQRRTLKGADCLALADPIWQQLSGTRYRWLQAQFIIERGECENLRGEFAESDHDLRMGRKIATDFEFPVLVLRSIGISAGIKRLQGKCDESWKETVEGLDLYWRGAHPEVDRLFQFYAVMLECALETGSLYAAEALILRAMEMEKNEVKSIRMGLLHLHLANILLAWKQGEAEKNERAMAASLLPKPGEPHFDEYQLYAEIEPAEFQLEQGNADLALATLAPARRLLHDAQDKFFPLNFNRVAGNIYFHLRRLDEAADSYRSAIEIAEASLVTITDNRRRLQWINATNESYRGLVQILLEEQQGERALGLWEWYKNRPWLEGRPAGIPATDISWTAIQRAISKPLAPSAAETRLVYASFKDHLAIWVLTGKGIQTKWFNVKQLDFQEAIRAFSEKCAAPDSSLAEVQAQGKKLYSLMLEPVSSVFSESATVIVELDPSASELPMEALVASDGSYFGQRHSVVYSPGMVMEKNLRMPVAIGIQESLLLVDASRSNAAGQLPGGDLERSTISHAFPHTTIIDSDTADMAQIRRALLGSAGFHFMGHGIRDGAGSDLMLNDNLSLKARYFSPEILKRSKLAVLSACSTGVGKENGLLDTENLVHSFLSAGVPSVIASHWNVDSASTGRLMSSFYANLAKGESVVHAIHDARNEMLTTQSHPYFWAGFNLAGRAN